MSALSRTNNIRNPTVRASSSLIGPTANSSAPKPGTLPRPVLPPGDKLESRTPFLDNLGSQMVDILVGPEEKLFRVHKNKLCKISYFHRLFNSGFKETTENIARFPEDDCGAFDLLIEWVYDPSLPRFADHNQNISPAKYQTRPDASWRLLDLYALAEKYCIPTLQNLAMDIIRKRHKQQNMLPSAQWVQQAYEKTPTDSALSKYAVTALYYIIDCKYSESDWPTSEVEKLFQELPCFASDYIKLQRSTSPVDPRDGPNSLYHTQRGDEDTKKKIVMEGAKRQSWKG